MKTRITDKSKQKKIVLTALCVCIAIIILYFTVPAILSKFGGEEETVERTYSFWPVEDDIDITADSGYMAKDRNYYYCDPSTNITISFDPDTLSDIPDTLQVAVGGLVRYIEYAKAGDEENLNKMFSDTYYENGFEAKSDFTPQKIYSVLFTYSSEDTVTEDAGTWDRFTFWVEYKIYKNNGTFRDDMESDCTRKELFVLTVRDGTLEIDGVTPYRVSN